MKLLSTLLLCLCIALGSNAQNLYASKSVAISFISNAPLEDIEASSKLGVGVLNFEKNEFVFEVAVKTFQFDISLMQEHFNENYLDSDRFPKASFRGKFKNPVDLTKDGTYPIVVEGKLSVRGVEKPRVIPGTIVVKNGIVSLNADFTIDCEAHNIKIPKIVEEKIADTVKVRVNGDFSLYFAKN